jgi:hypothetical protein
VLGEREGRKEHGKAGFAIQARRAGTRNQPSPEGLGPLGKAVRVPEVRHHTYAESRTSMKRAGSHCNPSHRALEVSDVFHRALAELRPGNHYFEPAFARKLSHQH